MKITIDNMIFLRFLHRSRRFRSVGSLNQCGGLERASAYKSLFDPGTKLMRGKDSKGKWRFPFNPFLLSHAASCGGDYTEGNAWQYTWHVQHDVAGLIDLMGGKESFAMKLGSLFMLDTIAENTGFVSDVSGFIGQYAWRWVQK